jgi:hypothetical protein
MARWVPHAGYRQTCLAAASRAGARDFRAFLLGRVQSFFGADDVPALEEPPHCATAAWDPFFRMAATISSNVKSGCSTISRSKNSAYPSRVSLAARLEKREYSS